MVPLTWPLLIALNLVVLRRERNECDSTSDRVNR
jgi:hypothetical protein